jgi:hypothetical protein
MMNLLSFEAPGKIIISSENQSLEKLSEKDLNLIKKNNSETKIHPKSSD